MFTQSEVKEVLSRLDGVNYLIATLLYGVEFGVRWIKSSEERDAGWRSARTNDVRTPSQMRTRTVPECVCLDSTIASINQLEKSRCIGTPARDLVRGAVGRATAIELYRLMIELT